MFLRGIRLFPTKYGEAHFGFFKIMQILFIFILALTTKKLQNNVALMRHPVYVHKNVWH